MKDDKTRLKSFQIERQNHFKRLYMLFYNRKLKKKAFVHVTWIDPSDAEHDYLAQWDGKQIEVDGVGPAGKLIFPMLDLVQTSKDSCGFTHVIFSHNTPEMAVIYPKRDISKVLTTQTISDLVMCDRISTMSSISQYGWKGAAKSIVITASIIMSLAIGFVIVASVLQGMM